MAGNGHNRSWCPVATSQYADFLAPAGALQRLQERYGGFGFKTVVKCEPGTQYYMLNRGEAEVANAFTTASNIAEDQLVVLADENTFGHAATLRRSSALPRSMLTPYTIRAQHDFTNTDGVRRTTDEHAPGFASYGSARRGRGIREDKPPQCSAMNLCSDR